MSGAGFFYSPEDEQQLSALKRKQALAQSLLSGGDAGAPGAAYSGLANAGNKIIGAILSNKLNKQEQGVTQGAQQKYQSDLANFLKGVTPQPAAPAVQPPSQISNNGGAGAPPPAPAGMPPPQATNTPGGPQSGGQPSAPAPQPPPPQSPLGALAGTGNIGLMQQFAPELLRHQLEVNDKQSRPLTPEEIKARGLRAGGSYEMDNFGHVTVAQEPDTKSPEALAQIGQTPLSPYQQAEIKLSQAQQNEAGRHNRVEETIAQNPFGGMGLSGAGGKTGDDFLASLSPGLAAQIKAVGTYRQPAPAGRTSPTGIKFMTLVNQAYPDYDSTQFGAKSKARNDFSTGKNGNTVRSLNVAISHLDTLGQLSSALGNGNVPLVNAIGQHFAQQTGGSAPTNFDAAKQIVGDEVVKAIIGTGGSQQDREEAAKQISRSSSPQQLSGVIQTYQHLLGGQLGGLKQQYEKTTGLHDFEDYLSPEVKSKLQPGPQAAVPAPAPNGSKAVLHYDANGNRIPGP